MKKGIIMEIKRDILVMMTPEGEFLTGRKQPDQHYAVGEEIPFFPLHTESAKSKPIHKWNWKVSTSLLTVLVVLIALFSSTVLQNNRAYAYVSVDINPSMELTLNKKQQVLEIKPFNDDAKFLLTKLSNWEDKDVGEVTEKIFLLSERLGYLKENQNVWITSSFINDSDRERETELLDELHEFVDDYRSEHPTNIIVKEISPEIREEASDKGMTAGSLMREAEQKETNQAIEPEESEKAVIKEEKEETDREEEKSETGNQKGEQPLKDNNQNGDKREDSQNNHPVPQNPHPGNKGKNEKPVKSQNGNSSFNNKGNRGNDITNKGHNNSSHTEQDHSRDNEKHNDHQNRNEEKKNTHEERKENKKD
ncbi:hypothetical protein CN378_13580 [Bacillus sp. AFS015802]|uniref:anti-sigma factor domain-containing protein n=1 Tax=Bacillus sp. AFS015802 TaxID=2033486 RepID=UPI000BF6F458|nr:anti-sigma factor domain-containing protein [Bacillus sp. AFS015802]PFA66328.1 hypothetical protein CN378_13580 [Bacillus sp. AFS015802]